MKLQLSISVLVSDRPSSLTKCFNSLLPILQEIPSELIVVYTGKSDESLEITKKYTDQIIPFEWCDDFSKARNIGLAQAKGEWFMFIDDDEWFEDCSEIIDFFKSGQDKSYNAACYLVRNYFDLNGTAYVDDYVYRMAKRFKDTRFVGIVHEGLLPWKDPIKYFNSYVHHYGYAEGFKEKKIDSSERNIPMLERQIALEPENVRYQAQLVQEYCRISKFDSAKNWCRKILEEDDGKWDIYYVHWVASVLIRVLTIENRAEEAFEEGKKLLDCQRLGDLFKLEIYTHLISLCINLEKYKECVDFAHDFIKLRVQMDARPEEWRRQQVLSVNKMNVLKKSNFVFANAVLCAVMVEEFDSIGVFLNEFSWDADKDLDEVYTFWSRWQKLFDPYREQILMAFSKVESDNPYILYQKALYFELKEDHATMEEMYLKCQKESNFFFAPGLILLAMRNNLELPAVIGEMDLGDWRNCAQQIAENTEVHNHTSDMERVEIIFDSYPLQRMVLQQKLLASNLYDESLSLQGFISMLKTYCDVVEELNRFLYREELFQKNLWFCLPKECRAVLEMQGVFELMDSREILECIRQIKVLLRGFPELSYLARRFADYLGENMMDSFGAANNREFYEIGQNVKVIMKKLAEDEMYKEALTIAEELGELLPKDTEVVKYKQQLRKMVE